VTAVFDVSGAMNTQHTDDELHSNRTFAISNSKPPHRCHTVITDYLTSRVEWRMF
jgi:hypothetical protein